MTTSVLSACQIIAKCADDSQVLELLQKCFVRIKTAKKITAISHENSKKRKLKKKQTNKNSNNNHEKRKIN